MRRVRFASVITSFAFAMLNSVFAMDSPLDGKWIVVRVVANQKEVNKKGYCFEFRNGRLFLHSPSGRENIGSFALDLKSEPNHFDVQIEEEGANKGKTSLGLFLHKGRELTICQARPGSPRPEAFLSNEECSVVYLEKVMEKRD